MEAIVNRLKIYIDFQSNFSYILQWFSVYKISYHLTRSKLTIFIVQHFRQIMQLVWKESIPGKISIHSIVLDLYNIDWMTTAGNPSSMGPY